MSAGCVAAAKKLAAGAGIIREGMENRREHSMTT